MASTSHNSRIPAGKMSTDDLRFLLGEAAHQGYAQLAGEIDPDTEGNRRSCTGRREVGKRSCLRKSDVSGLQRNGGEFLPFPVEAGLCLERGGLFQRV